MASSVDSLSIQTVLGPIPASELGRTHTHEHLLVDLTPGIPVSRMTPEEQARLDDEITLSNYYEIRRDHWNRNECRLDEEDLAVKEMIRFREAGGGAVVDVTPLGAGRDVEGLARISRRSGVHVVAAAGFYLSAYHPAKVATADVQEITKWIIDEVVEGIPGTDIRASIIGEVGMGWPVHPDEEKVLQASAHAQAETGVPLMVHPGINPAAPLKHLATIEAAGGDIKRTIVAHIDRTLFELDDMKALADTGCYLEIDLFGRESAHHPFSPIDMLNDAGRVNVLMDLIAAGYGSQLLIAQDICHKTNLINYGGEGYAHLLKHVVPMMKRKGMSEESIDMLFIENPKHALSK